MIDEDESVRNRRDFFDEEAMEGEPESPSTESEPPGQDLDAMDDFMEDDSILDRYDDSFIDDRNATNIAPGGRLGRDFDDSWAGVLEAEESLEEPNAVDEITIHVPQQQGLSLQQLRLV